MKKFLALLCSLTMMVSLAACGGSGDAGDTGGDTGGDAGNGGDAGGAENLKISVILKTTSSEYWQYVQAGANGYMADHPEVTVEVKGASSETAYDEQQAMIETDLASGGYDGFVIAPLQADVVTTLIAGQTTPIIAVDTKIDAPEILSFVGTGNVAAATLGGEVAYDAAVEAGWEEVTNIHIAGVQGDNTSDDRMAGFKAGVESKGGTTLSDEVQYANAVADQAVAAMEAIMQNHPEGIAIISANNDDMAMAAARAAQGNEAYANTIFIGFDGIQSACNAILADELTMSVAQEAYDMGYKAVEAAVAAIGGEQIESFIDSGASVVTKENAQERLDTLTGYIG